MENESSLRAPFQNLLDRSAKLFNWILVPEDPIFLRGGKRIVPDGTVRDHYRIPHGWWESKDSKDKLATEASRKIDLGYPARNTIFEDSRRALLYQDRRISGEFDLRQPDSVAHLLGTFYSHELAEYHEFDHALRDFLDRIPELAAALQNTIAAAHKNLPAFQHAYKDFLELCRSSLNPDTSPQAVDEMLIQHILTERIIRNLFGKAEFTHQNVIAQEVEKVIAALASKSFSRAEFQGRFDKFYKAIERAAEQTADVREKQAFLNRIYEGFFQKYSWKTADTHGIVYTPQEIVDSMCGAVERTLKEEFGKGLGDDSVVILDPCTGTGNFVVNLIHRMPRTKLEKAYRHRLFANEVMLLPYYVASLNIERAYFEAMGQYEPFEGLCFVDTLDMAESAQLAMFTPENTARVKREKDAAITVILGNPPYNVGQRNENDNNQNRKYKQVDHRVRETYTKDSKASSKSKLDDVYVKFFRWASDRLGDRDGIVCYVSNNGFIDRIAFDGMRKHLLQDFTRIDHIDLHGDVRRNPKLSGTTHNVFGIQVGVGITVAIRRKGLKPALRYHRVPEMWRKSEKLDFLETGKIEWRTLEPDAEHTWLIPEHADEWREFAPLEKLFDLYSVGVLTSRDEVVYDFAREALAERVANFIETYNSEVDRRKRTKGTFLFDDRIKWSEGLKLNAKRSRQAEYNANCIRSALYRPFSKRWLYFDRILNERVYQWPKIEGRVMWVKVGAAWPFFALAADCICDLLPQGGSQCFPLSHLKDDAPAKFGLSSKLDTFHYIYALLHHPEYRARYADNLKRELPRIPRAPNVAPFVEAGKKLAQLHVEYETLEPWPLEERHNKAVPFTWRVEKMRLSRDKSEVQVNGALKLGGIPEKAYAYRLGSRSAIEWVIDQYRVTTNSDGSLSDPNRADDPEYIVRLIGQVVRVSVETVEIVAALPAFR
ncbi:MAG: type ISP restriction/modification enzyme [Bryobacteraceae bacterium]|nr:type ISP restriction/modification enzyme [Bryobacteraceae bacterium]